jgi:hypothetical protein
MAHGSQKVGVLEHLIFATRHALLQVSYLAPECHSGEVASGGAER